MVRGLVCGRRLILARRVQLVKSALVQGDELARDRSVGCAVCWVLLGV